MTQHSYWQPIERGEYGFSSRFNWRCAHCGKWSEDTTPECPKCGAKMGVIYLCDPELNGACRKTSCFIYGGACRHTQKIECSRQPDKVHLDKYAEFDRKRGQK